MIDKNEAREAVGEYMAYVIAAEIADLEHQLYHKSRSIDSLQDRMEKLTSEAAGLERAILALRKRAPTACPRCSLKQNREPDTAGVCCPKCGYCDAVQAELPEACDYHAGRVMA